MGPLQSYVSELFGLAGRMGGLGADMLGDRLELAALELKEAKIRLIQVLILAMTATALCLLGLGFGLVALVLSVPEPWRLYSIAGLSGLCLLCGLVGLVCLKRRLSRQALPFAQSLAELQKDRQCF